MNDKGYQERAGEMEAMFDLFKEELEEYNMNKEREEKLKFKDFDLYYDKKNFGDFGEQVNSWHVTDLQVTAILPHGTDIYYDTSEAVGITEDTEISAIKVWCDVYNAEGEKINTPIIVCTDPESLWDAFDIMNDRCRDIEHRVKEGIEEDWDMTEEIEEVIEELKEELQKFGKVEGIPDKTKEKKKITKKAIKKVVKKKKAVK
jgi:cob(I)alamin adenosyltransferase